MRRLTILVVVLAAIYSGYWFVGASRVSNGIENAITQMQSDGLDATADVATKGFPSRFDTTLTDFRFGNPNTGFVYEAPFIQVLALSYRPNNVILVLPDEQRISWAYDAGTLSADQIRASATAKPNLSLAFDNLTAEGSNLTFDADSGWTFNLESLLAAARLKPEQDSRYDVYANLNQLTLPGAGGIMSEVFLDGDVTLQDPLDRTTQEVIVEQLVVKSLRIVWADVELSGQGQLDVDAAGLPEGQIMLQIENWREIIPKLVETGLIATDFAQTALGMGSLLSGGQDTMTLPLKYENGRGTLGPLPLGPAPRLHFTR